MHGLSSDVLDALIQLALGIAWMRLARHSNGSSVTAADIRAMSWQLVNCMAAWLCAAPASVGLPGFPEHVWGSEMELMYNEAERCEECGRLGQAQA